MAALGSSVPIPGTPPSYMNSVTYTCSMQTPTDPWGVSANIYSYCARPSNPGNAAADGCPAIVASSYMATVKGLTPSGFDYLYSLQFDEGGPDCPPPPNGAGRRLQGDGDRKKGRKPIPLIQLPTAAQIAAAIQAAKDRILARIAQVGLCNFKLELAAAITKELTCVA